MIHSTVIFPSFLLHLGDRNLLFLFLSADRSTDRVPFSVPSPFNVDGNAIIFCVYFKAVPQYRYHKTVYGCYLPKLKAFAFYVPLFFFIPSTVDADLIQRFGYLDEKLLRKEKVPGINRLT